MFHVKQPGAPIDLKTSQLVVLKICRDNGLQLTEQQLLLLTRYASLVSEWNQKINLISRRDEENFWYAHILHSLSPLFFIEIPAGLRVMDLGSGGGLPGIPWAIVRTDLELTLLDSIQKKAAAVFSIVAELRLSNARVIGSRAEDLSLDSKSRFDLVVARAVAPLASLIRWARPLVRRGSHPQEEPVSRLRRFTPPYLLALKGGNLVSELREATIKTGESRITVVDLGFHGSAELGLTEKKIIVVEFN